MYHAKIRKYMLLGIKLLHILYINTMDLNLTCRSAIVSFLVLRKQVIITQHDISETERGI